MENKKPAQALELRNIISITWEMPYYVRRIYCGKGKNTGNKALGMCNSGMRASADDAQPCAGGERARTDGGGPTSDSVSYTHLDVYKRQCLSSSILDFTGSA